MPAVLGKKRIGVNAPNKSFQQRGFGSQNCPRCGARMIQVDLAQLSAGNVFVTLECTACHYRMQQKR